MVWFGCFFFSPRKTQSTLILGLLTLETHQSPFCHQSLLDAAAPCVLSVHRDINPVLAGSWCVTPRSDATADTVSHGAILLPALCRFGLCFSRFHARGAARCRKGLGVVCTEQYKDVIKQSCSVCSRGGSGVTRTKRFFSMPASIHCAHRSPHHLLLLSVWLHNSGVAAGAAVRSLRSLLWHSTAFGLVQFIITWNVFDGTCACCRSCLQGVRE